MGYQVKHAMDVDVLTTRKKKIKKNNGLPGKTCDRCRCTDDQYRDKHEEQIKLYRDQ